MTIFEALTLKKMQCETIRVLSVNLHIKAHRKENETFKVLLGHWLNLFRFLLVVVLYLQSVG